MKKTIIRLLLILLVISLFGTGCAGYKATHYIKLEDGLIPKITDHKNIPVFKEDELPSRPYQILGKVYTIRRVNNVFEKEKMGEDALIETLKKQAVEMGAEAIIKVHYSNFVVDDKYGPRELPVLGWARGLPVRYLKEETEVYEGMGRIPFGVTILPVFDFTKDKPEISEYNEVGQKIAQYILENRGYYSVFLNTDSIITLDDINELAILSLLGGEDTGFILLLTIEDAAKVDILIAKAEAVMVKATLVSKETREIVWEKEMTGSYYAGWIRRTFEDEKEMALTGGLRVLKSLPTYEGMIEIKE
jgi:hypothetical protein